MSETVDCVVIGAGVVGLAVARALALAGREVVVVEAGPAIGTEISSRNSEVIHAGIYYPAGSLKAVLCVAGKQMLYRYCGERGLAHRRCGKLIVATAEAQIPSLEKLRQQGRANGVDDLTMLTASEARALEPNLRCAAALYSPSTGIIDSHALMLSFQGDAEAHGAVVAFNSPVLRGRVSDGGVELEIGGADPLRLLAHAAVNAAGLAAPPLARRIHGLSADCVPQDYLAKGSYFALDGRAPFSRLIYPMPEPGGLGVHITLDLAGQARFGPDVEWIDQIDYDVDPSRADRFYAEIRKYWPDLPDGALHPAYSGIRPKIAGPGAPAADFVIQGPETHRVPGLVNLFGIESPGLTASPAIAARVAAILAR
ncbi:MAG TPA: NAD(P)/FAD-dependent oxidoreductase [Alphaproteobacteria bacterium]|nr:NAD(P)/FAD-dependent oxidoreductase [Alphaproteobacteria bacterium]